MRATIVLATVLAATGCGSRDRPARSAPPPADAAPAPPDAAPEAALIDRLLAEEIAAYSPTTQTAVFARLHQQESSGTGLGIAFVHAGKTEVVEIYPPGASDAPAAIAQARAAHRAELERRLAGQGFVALTPIAWPEDAPELAIPDRGERLRWAAPTLSLVPPRGKPRKLRTFASDTPHVAAPTAVYAAAGVPAALVLFAWVPGPAYLAGYNAFTTLEIVPLPPRP